MSFVYFLFTVTATLKQISEPCCPTPSFETVPLEAQHPTKQQVKLKFRIICVTSVGRRFDNKTCKVTERR
jgi:hypothetical protein